MSDYARTALLMMTPSFRRRSTVKQQRSSCVSRPRPATSKKHSDNDGNNANAAPARTISFQEKQKMQDHTPGVRNGNRRYGRGLHGDNHPLNNAVQHQNHTQHQNSLSQLTMSQLSQESFGSHHSLSLHPNSQNPHGSSRSLIFRGTRNAPITIDVGASDTAIGSTVRTGRRGSKVSRKNLSKSLSSTTNENDLNDTNAANGNISTRKRSWMEAIHDVISTPYRKQKSGEFRPPAKPQKLKKNQSLHDALTKNNIGINYEDNESESIKILESVPPNTSKGSQPVDEHKVFRQEQQIAKGLLDEIKAQVIEINTMARADKKCVQDMFEEFKDFVQSEKKEINLLIEKSQDLNLTVKTGVEDIVSNAQKIVQVIDTNKLDNQVNVDAVMASSNTLKSFIERSFKEFFHKDSTRQKEKRNVTKNMNSNNMKGTSTLISNRSYSPDSSSSVGEGTSTEQDIDICQNTLVQKGITQEKNENKRLTRSRKRFMSNQETSLPKKPKTQALTDSSKDKLLLTDQSGHRSKEKAKSKMCHAKGNNVRKNIPCEIVTIPIQDASDKTASSDLTEMKSPKKSIDHKSDLSRNTGPVSRKERESHTSREIGRRRRRTSAPRRAKSNNTFEKDADTETMSTARGRNRKIALGLNCGSKEGKKANQKRPHPLPLRRRRRVRNTKAKTEKEKSYSKLFSSKFTSFFKASDDSDPFEFK